MTEIYRQRGVFVLSMNSVGIDYSLALTELNLDDINDSIFNEIVTIWLKFVNRQIQELKKMFPTPRDIKYIEKVNTN